MYGINIGKKREMLHILKYFCAFPFVSFFILLSAHFASSATLVYIDPATTAVAVGSSFSIDVRVSNVSNLYGAQIELQFDPSILEGTSIVPGNAPSPDFIVTQTIHNDTGIIDYAATSLSPSPPITGNGIMLTINFKKIALGTSSLGFNSVLLADPDGISISTATQEGSVEDIATDPTLIFIDPATTRVAVGSSFSIDIRVSNVSDLYGAQIELQFDPSILEGTSIVPGNAPSPDFIVTQTIHNDTGIIDYAATSLSPSPTVTGDGIILTINFKKIALGTSSLGFNETLLSDSNGSPITSVTVNGIIEERIISKEQILWLTLPAIINNPQP